MNTKHFGKKLTCALGLVLCLCLLAGCSGGDGTGKTFEVVTEPTQNTLGSLNATDTPTQAPTSVPDPIAEENVHGIPSETAILQKTIQMYSRSS